MTPSECHKFVSSATGLFSGNNERKLVIAIAGMASLLLTVWLLSSVALSGIVYAQSSADQNGTAGSTNETITLLRYLNPTFGIEMNYPSSWQAYELWKSNSPAVANTIVAMLPAGDNTTSSFRDSLLVGMQGAEGKTLNEYTVDSLNAYRDPATNVTIASSAPTTLDGIPAHEIEYSENFGGKELQKKQIWAIIDNRAYIVTYGADTSQYENYLEDVDNMIDSIQISRTPPELTTNTNSATRSGLLLVAT